MEPTTYVLMRREPANRVYGAAAPALTAAELRFVDRCLFGGVVTAVEPVAWGDDEHLALTCARPFDDGELAVVANLSTVQALFERVGDGELLRPVPLVRRRVQDEDVVTIQRYAGKTNEQFTHLLVNLALAAAGAFRPLLAGEPVRLLDPVAGRGTSLNRALVYGADAVGIEVDRRDVDAYVQFLTTWMKDKRLVHDTTSETLRRGRDTPARRVAIAYGRDRKGPRRRVELVQDDTVLAGDHVRDRSVDVVVADLPYGVQHGGRGPGGRLSRSPEELLTAALPAWARLVRPGGAVALGWNLRSLPRPRLVELARHAGLVPCGPADDASFVHRVDRVITRDVVVATRPA